MVSWSISRQRAFLRADAGGEIAEMVDRQRDVGEGRLADRLAVVDGLDRGEHLEVLLHAVGDLVEDLGALGGRGVAPGVLGLMRGVERKLDIGGLRAGDLADRLAGDGADIVEIVAVDRRHPFAADEIVVARAQRHPRIQSLDDLVKHTVLPWTQGAAFRVSSGSILSPALTWVKLELQRPEPDSHRPRRHAGQVKGRFSPASSSRPGCNVRFGSKADALHGVTLCPLYPRTDILSVCINVC